MEEKNKEVKEEKKTKETTQEQKNENKKEIKDTKKEEKATVEKKEQFKKVDVKKADDKEAKIKKDNKNVKNKDKKSTKKSWIIPTIVTIIVLAIVGILTFMIVTSSTPKKSVDGLFTNLKAGDFEKAREFMKTEEENNTELLDNDLKDETKALLFDKLTWKVTKVAENGNEANIDIEITNKNYKTIIAKVMQKALKAAFSGEEMTEEQSQNYLTEELKNEQAETTTVTKTIKAVKVNKDWKIEESDELIDSILPGLQEAIDSLGY